jgi:hypothetical protein
MFFGGVYAEVTTILPIQVRYEIFTIIAPAGHGVNGAWTVLREEQY